MNSRKTRSNGIEILIAEDSPTQAEKLRYLLEKHGYAVVTAPDGKQALAAVQRRKPALVISDIVMPEMNGYELCKAIKSDEALRETPVILVTTLSDVMDIMQGLECGADNFIRKPYEEKYLLARVDYLLMNQEMRKSQKMQMGMEIHLGGQKHFITAERQQIVDLLISVYEEAVHISEELRARQRDLAESNRSLTGLYHVAEGLNRAVSEREVCEKALEHAQELPGVRAGWISLWEDGAFRTAAARNLPPALLTAGAMEGICECRRRFLAGELDHVTNILECERLQAATGDTNGLRYHASVPLWIGERMLGIMNLVGEDQGLFKDGELEILYGVGHQVGIALERARLHEGLEQLVEERTAALRASEARLRTIIEAEPECVKIVDVEGRIVQMNAAGLAMLEADSLEQVLGGKIAEFVVLAQREAYRAFEASVLDGKSAAFEFEIAGLKGAHLWLDTHAVPLPEQQNGHPQMLAITRDVTERKHAEEALRDSRESLHRLLNSMVEGAYGVDTNGYCTFVNRAFLQILGYQDVNELLGKHIHELIHHSHADGSPYPASECRMYRAYQDHQSINVSDEVFWRRDGVAIPVEYWSHPIVTDDAVIGAIATFFDITRRKENEARIARLNRIFSVLSGINTAIVRIRDRQQLFEEACRIAVEHGKFVFAWIGTFDADTQQVTPVARAGHEDGYLDQVNLTVVEGAPGNCYLTAEAITQAKPVICNDIAADDRIGNLDKQALMRGYRSLAVFPLVVESRPVGVFVLYAPETGVFDDEEMRLLSEMAGDVSFALDHLEKEERLNYLAFFDAITGLSNRTLFLDRAGQQIHAMRKEEKTFSVILLDLDRFSGVNDTFGRQAGDDLLRQIATRLKEMLDETYILARSSADNFSIATRGGDEDQDIAHLLGSILSNIQDQPFLVGGQNLRITARAGIAAYPADGEDIETLLRNAEAALKKAKLSGDKYLFYAPEFNARVAEKLSLENKLRRALEQEQLVLHYQPKVDLMSGQICGLEALLRWNDPETGLVPPVKFIPLLEETGMILEAGRWALTQAVSDSRAWQAKGLRAPRIAVNVSPIQLQQKDFVSIVASVISGAGDAAVELELEITESLIMQDIEANIQKLRAIREIGIEVAIDDFGTGYSSLSYIAKLPVNTLKIDRAFVVNMTSSSDDLSIVSTIISLAHSLNLRVVAEGVETEAQANLLRLLKCNEMQGFLFSPGVPAEQIETILREKKSLST
ncbi:MAG: response regulator receiver [Rhodocyclaceae bacterium]|nr:MAG: response regulator receiver [Rhodocyclaceae bacterium]TND03909.1 MAG: response regulator receiver/GGDEF/EAL domain-containing protein [Rhodocyclaceae bacterium]